MEDKQTVPNKGLKGIVIQIASTFKTVSATS